MLNRLLTVLVLLSLLGPAPAHACDMTSSSPSDQVHAMDTDAMTSMLAELNI